MPKVLISYVSLFANLLRPNLANKSLNLFAVQKMPFYAVRVGKRPGVYLTWPECEQQVKGFPCARFKKFSTDEEAQQFVRATSPAKGGSGIAEASNNAAPDKPELTAVPPLTATGSTTALKRLKTKPSADASQPKAAKKSATAPAPSASEPVIVYTDGCCLQNGRRTPQAGIGVYWGKKHADNLSERLLGRQTNNRAEIYAVIRAVQQAKRHGIKHLQVHTDSQFLINCMTKWIKKWKKNDWKLVNGGNVLNRKELQKLDAEQEDIKVTYVHVAGHSGIEGNEAADQLANKGAALPYIKNFQDSDDEFDGDYF